MRVNISHMDTSKSSWENLKRRLRYTGNDDDISDTRDSSPLHRETSAIEPAVRVRVSSRRRRDMGYVVFKYIFKLGKTPILAQLFFEIANLAQEKPVKF